MMPLTIDLFRLLTAEFSVLDQYFSSLLIRLNATQNDMENNSFRQVKTFVNFVRAKVGARRDLKSLFRT